MSSFELTETQLVAAKKILALRALTKCTNTVTSRAQSLVLRPLNEVDLTAVAEYLQSEGQ